MIELIRVCSEQLILALIDEKTNRLETASVSFTAFRWLS